MAIKETQAQMHEKLLKAMSEGEFGLVKFIWEIYTRIDEISDKLPSEVSKIHEEVSKFRKQYKQPKDGRDGVGKEGKQGPPGKSVMGPKGERGRDGRDGIAKDGKDGKQGPMGKMPAHEWDGTKIRFQLPNGWGPWVDIRGPAGLHGVTFDSGPSAAGGLERVRGAGFVREGVSEIYFGIGFTLTRTGNGVRVDATGGGGGVGAWSTPIESPKSDGSIKIFTVGIPAPTDVVADGTMYFEGFGYNYDSGHGGTITFDIGGGGPTQYVRTR